MVKKVPKLSGRADALLPVLKKSQSSYTPFRSCLEWAWATHHIPVLSVSLENQRCLQGALKVIEFSSLLSAITASTKMLPVGRL